MNKIKQLDDSQLENFDDEFVSPNRRAKIKEHIDARFPDGKFRFMDVGGGNGTFADEILKDYPLAEGLVLDNSHLLIEKNIPNPRKKWICESIENVEKVVNEKFDLIFFNFVLHHLVSDSYAESRRNQVTALKVARSMLNENGAVSVFENVYDGVIFQGLPSHLIFALTKSRLLQPLIKRLGANTAGVGVCFLGNNQWHKSMAKSGLAIRDFTNFERLHISTLKKLILTLGYARSALYWCVPDSMQA